MNLPISISVNGVSLNGKSFFASCCILAGAGEPVAEFAFKPPRRWRFDYAWPDCKVALEIEGGLFGRGKKCLYCGQRRKSGHTSIERLKSDMEKYNAAAIDGWRVLRCTPDQFKSGDGLSLVIHAIRGNG